MKLKRIYATFHHAQIWGGHGKQYILVPTVGQYAMSDTLFYPTYFSHSVTKLPKSPGASNRGLTSFQTKLSLTKLSQAQLPYRA